MVRSSQPRPRVVCVCLCVYTCCSGSTYTSVNTDCVTFQPTWLTLSDTCTYVLVQVLMCVRTCVREVYNCVHTHFLQETVR